MTARKTAWGKARKGKPREEVWIVDFWHEEPDGKRARVRERSPVNTKRGAEQHERDLRAAFQNPQPKAKEVPTLREFAKEFMETYAKVNNKPSEVGTKECHLKHHIKPALGNLRLDQIGVRQIEHFKAALLDKKLAPKSVNNILAVLGKMLRYAEEIEVIDKVPRIRLMKTTPPEFDFLDFDEAGRLLTTAETIYPEWHVMVFTALKTGLRYGELCELRWNDVDLVAGRLRALRSYYRGHVTTPKSGKGREVPLSPGTVKVLKRHRHLRGELVFCQSDGARLKDSTADDAIKRIAKRAGLRRIGWHVCRHTFASHLVMRGAPIKAVQELLGHSTINMTERYAHLSPDVRRDAVALLDLQGSSWAADNAQKPNVSGTLN